MLLKVTRAALQFFLYAVFAVLALVSVPLFQESVLLGLAFNGPALLYLLLRAMNVIRKSRAAVGFMLFSLGMLEIHLGVAKGYPVFWVIGLACFLVMFFWSWYKAEAAMADGEGSFKAPQSEVDHPGSPSLYATGRMKVLTSDPQYQRWLGED